MTTWPALKLKCRSCQATASNTIPTKESRQKPKTVGLESSAVFFVWSLFYGVLLFGKAIITRRPDLRCEMAETHRISLPHHRPESKRTACLPVARQIHSPRLPNRQVLRFAKASRALRTALFPSPIFVALSSRTGCGQDQASALQHD